MHRPRRHRRALARRRGLHGGARGAVPDLVLRRPQVGKNLLSDTLALTAAGQIVRHLERAVTDGADLEARSRMLYGSLLAGSRSPTPASPPRTRCSSPGALTHTSHGLGTGLLSLT